MLIRYRTGTDARTGAMLRGFDHLRQSIGKILTTMLEEQVMLLDYGSDLVRQIGRNMGREVILNLFQGATEAVHKWEPEFRVKQLELQGIERTGGVQMVLRGLYYPEGRFGNFDIFETREAVIVVAVGEVTGRSR